MTTLCNTLLDIEIQNQ